MANSVEQKEGQNLSAILKSDLFSDLVPAEVKTITENTEILMLQKGGLLAARTFFLLTPESLNYIIIQTFISYNTKAIKDCL